MDFGHDRTTARRMRAVASSETLPERKIRAALWSAGARGYRKNFGGLPGKPDIYYPRAGLAVFVHGCFWHGCRQCTRNLAPRRNADYWRSKVARNKRRDREVQAAIRRQGIEHIVLWECEISESPSRAADRVLAALRRLGSPRDRRESLGVPSIRATKFQRGTEA